MLIPSSKNYKHFGAEESCRYICETLWNFGLRWAHWKFSHWCKGSMFCMKRIGEPKSCSFARLAHSNIRLHAKVRSDRQNWLTSGQWRISDFKNCILKCFSCLYVISLDCDSLFHSFSLRSWTLELCDWERGIKECQQVCLWRQESSQATLALYETDLFYNADCFSLNFLSFCLLFLLILQKSCFQTLTNRLSGWFFVLSSKLPVTHAKNLQRIINSRNCVLKSLVGQSEREKL